MPIKFALIHLGNEEQYGLLFAGAEFKKYGEIRFFDSELDNDYISKVLSFNPDYICFSLLSVFANKAIQIIQQIKGTAKIIVGGHHTLNNDMDVDYIVKGTSHNVFKKIGKEKVIINPPLNPNEYPLPVREEYFRDIPRLKNRYRKVMCSMLGCYLNCSYCSSGCGNTIKLWGKDVYKTAYLTHRNIDTIIKEAEFIKNTTQEIEWSDDDLFSSDYEWVTDFINTWREKINIPLYTQTCSKSILKVPDYILTNFRSISNCIGVGIQAISPETLKLYNRQWDNIEQMKKGVARLKEFGFKVNPQAIVGPPVKDPFDDALTTLEGLKEIAKGDVVSIYPLQLYNGTALYRYCQEKNIALNNNCSGDTNMGIPAIKYDEITTRRLKNICKLGTMIVQFNIPKEWYLPLLDIDYNENVSKSLSTIRYKSCINDRLGEKGLEIFNDIMKGMNLRS